jgi:hypothetical protein
LILHWCDLSVSNQSLVLCAFNVEVQKDSQGTVASCRNEVYRMAADLC